MFSFMCHALYSWLRHWSSCICKYRTGRKNRKVEEYVQQVQEHNEEVSLLNLEDIPATITLESNITYTQLSEYIADNNLETVQLQARGIDANGERVTFASKTYKGLFETDQMIKRLAQDNNIEFVGYNAMYVLIDSTQIISVQMMI